MLNTLNKKLKIAKSGLVPGKKYFLIAVCASFFTLAGCGEGAKDNNMNADVPAGMVAADLSAQGVAVVVHVPDSTVAPLEVMANAQGGADVKVGPNFQITVTEGEGNVDLKKNDITNDDIRKFVKYVVEEPNALVWEWQIADMEPEFHFYAIVKDGGKSFEVRDIEGGVFTEKAAMQMLDAAKTVRVKTAPKADS